MDRPSLLLTRPVAQARDFLTRIDPACLAGVDVCISPLLDIVPLDVAPDLSGYAGVIFTSGRGVALAPRGEGRIAYAVGERTAGAARQANWEVAHVGQDAGALVAALGKAHVPGPLLHLSGQHRRGDIADRLTDLGITTDVCVLYDQVLAPLSVLAQKMLMGRGLVVVPLFSPRTAAQFMAQASSLQRVQSLAMSAAVGEIVADDLVRSVHISTAPTGQAMAQGVENLLRGTSLP